MVPGSTPKHRPTGPGTASPPHAAIHIHLGQTPEPPTASRVKPQRCRPDSARVIDLVFLLEASREIIMADVHRICEEAAIIVIKRKPLRIWEIKFMPRP